MLYGNWTYTSMLKKSIQASIVPHGHLQLMDLYLFIAVLAGMSVSAFLKRASNSNLSRQRDGQSILLVVL